MIKCVVSQIVKEFVVSFDPSTGALSVGDFSRNISKVLHQVEEEQKAVIVTRTGRPVVAVVPIDPDSWDSYMRYIADALSKPVQIPDL